MLAAAEEEHLLSGQDQSVKARFFTISSQITCFKTVAEEMGQIYRRSE